MLSSTRTSSRRPVHALLARLPAYLREQGAPQLLIVTTNYDLALEQAFLEAGEEFDVVSYIAAGPHRGKFSHLPPSGEPRIIERCQHVLRARRRTFAR